MVNLAQMIDSSNTAPMTQNPCCAYVAFIGG